MINDPNIDLGHMAETEEGIRFGGKVRGRARTR